MGCFGEPYWEVYPDRKGKDVFRCKMSDTKVLIKEISKSVERQLKEGNFKDRKKKDFSKAIKELGDVIQEIIKNKD